MVNNDIFFEDDYWENDPTKAKWLDEIKESVYNGTYRGKEDSDIQKALVCYGDWKI